MTSTLEDIQNLVSSAFIDEGVEVGIFPSYINIIAPLELNGRVLSFLKDQPHAAFHQLIDLVGVDFYPQAPRFELVYHLLSMKHNLRARVKVTVHENETPLSASTIFSNASWHEREVFDMYGIVFKDHADMRRILTEYDFQGHPLRKDFPLFGYTQVKYDDELKRVVHEPVDLPQMSREFEFESDWRGSNHDH